MATIAQAVKEKGKKYLNLFNKTNHRTKFEGCLWNGTHWYGFCFPGNSDLDLLTSQTIGLSCSIREISRWKIEDCGWSET